MEKLLNLPKICPRFKRYLYIPSAVLMVLLTACHAQNIASKQVHMAHHLRGKFGAVVSDTQESTRAGIDILRQGGNAIDAAIAVASTLGVSDPLVAGLGGGGYLLYYDAHTHRILTIDGREKAGKNATVNLFIDPHSHKPLAYEQANTGGLPVGVPGQLALWQLAVQKWGKFSLAHDLAPAITVAQQGYVVTPGLHTELIDAASRMQKFTSSSALFFPHGAPLTVGMHETNPDLAHTYELIAQHGVQEFYHGPITRDIVQAVDHPPVAAGQESTRGNLVLDDFRDYTAAIMPPVHSTYAGLDIYGMGSSSSGGATVAEILNILSHFPLATEPRGLALHQYLEASKLAFADREQYLGDPKYTHVPVEEILSPEFAVRRAALIKSNAVLATPQPAGALLSNSSAADSPAIVGHYPNHEGTHTNHFVVSDRDGDIVSYTNTINFYGGSGITVPGRGFLLNDELTDFDFVPEVEHDPNLPTPNKRPLSAMSPTIVVHHGVPWLALGSPGGPTIITTVVQTLINRIDFHMPLVQAVAAPRASERNSRATQIESAFAQEPHMHYLEHLGHKFYIAASADENPQQDTPSTIGVVAALEFTGPQIIAVGESERRGGTWAATVQ